MRHHRNEGLVAFSLGLSLLWVGGASAHGNREKVDPRPAQYPTHITLPINTGGGRN